MEESVGWKMGNGGLRDAIVGCGGFKLERGGEDGSSDGMNAKVVGGKTGDGGLRNATGNCGGFGFEGRSRDGTSLRAATDGDVGWGISRELRRRRRSEEVKR